MAETHVFSLFPRSYPSQYYDGRPSEWENLMATVKSSGGSTYIHDYAELDNVLSLYDVYRTRGVNRETVSHIMQGEVEVVLVAE